MATSPKGKTKATSPKGKPEVTALTKFLSNLAKDARKLGEFLHKPEEAMSDAKLSEEDKTALRSGVAGMVYARLQGTPLDQAFRPMVHNVVYPPPINVSKAATPQAPMFYHQVQPPPINVSKAAPPPMIQIIEAAKAAPMIYHQFQVQPPPMVYHHVQPPPMIYHQVQPPPLIHPMQHAAPQHAIYPQQYVVQPPPQYVVYPPQFVVQWPYYPQ